MGSLRLFLVMIVVVYHARRLLPLPTLPLLPIPDGHEALWLFFTMSGFYMAFILNEKYPASRTLLFYANRWLRIWPMYVAALFFLGVFVLKTGVVCAMQCMDLGYLGQLLDTIPTGWLLAILFANLFMIGLDAQWALTLAPRGAFGQGPVAASFNPWPSPQLNGPLFTLINPAWSLAIELVFYAVAPFILRSLPRTIFVLLASLAIHIYFGPTQHYWIFFFAPAVYLFFMLGALAYQSMRRWQGWHENRRNQLIALAWCFVCWQISHAFPQVDPAHPIGLHSYLKIIGFLPLLPVLFHVTSRSRFDRFCADVSYPIFILHGPIFIYAFHTWPNSTQTNATIYIVIASLVAGLCGYLLVERPIGLWREAWTAKKLQR